MAALQRLDEILIEARKISGEVMAQEAERVDRDAAWPERGLRALQHVGLGGLVIPREKGGLGQGLYGLAKVCEVLGEICPSTAICFGMHCVGSAVVSAKSTLEHQTDFLDPINQGKHLTTIALSEPGSGSHFYFPQTKLAKVSAQAFSVTGAKAFVTNGSHADSYVVSVAAEASTMESGHFSCVVVRNGLPGMVWGPRWEGFGMRGNDSRTLQLNEVTLQRRDLLGQEGDQLWYLFHIVAPYFLMAMSGTYLGIAATAFEAAKTHVASRRYTHSGNLLGHYGVMQHRLGWLWGQLERTRQLIYAAGLEGDEQGPNALLMLLSAKAEVADCAVTIANEAMTIMGGSAYGEHSRVARLLRDARAAHVMAPTTDLLRTWAGRAVLGLPLLAD